MNFSRFVSYPGHLAKKCKTPGVRNQSGQAMVGLLFMTSLVIMGGVALTIDVSAMYFHRQEAQAAADAACQAGAVDMLGADSGMTLTTGFTQGSAGDCAVNSSISMCKYASFNGYSGGGLVVNASSNDVSYSFPSTASGVTPPSSALVPYPFLQIMIKENVPLSFLHSFGGNRAQQINTTSICGMTVVSGAPPMVILHPTMAGALNYSGGASLKIVTGSARALQINSSNANAVAYYPSGMIDTSKAGSAGTGADIAVVGGPVAAPANYSQAGVNTGTSGAWRSGVIPLIDPFQGVAVPAAMRTLTPVSGVHGTWVKYHQDGCADHSGSTGNPNQACIEFAPGYYPAGINIPSIVNNYSTAIFLPGTYYLAGSLVASGSNTLRNATPCLPTCGSLSTKTGQQTDGATFYFSSGSMNLSGCSGCSSSNIDNVSPNALTCDGTAPSSSLNLPSSLTGNVLLAPCTAHGTYVDGYSDSSDTQGTASAPGIRGLLIFQDHQNQTAPVLSGSGSLTFSGSLYIHSSTYADVLTINGGASTSSFVVGNIIVDQLNLSGSGAINLGLQSQSGVQLVKLGIFN